jgi:serine protease AprX
VGLVVAKRHTERSLFARLMNEKQAKKIDATLGKKDRCIYHVWLDKKMSACVETAAATINAAAAARLFSGEGKGVHWAVLDTGIDYGHSWVKPKSADLASLRHNFTGEPDGDDVGHGTHVAGIIAKLAPKVVLHDYKVLGREGGSSSTIISAMYEIRKMNFEAKKMLIHGVNMSLGAPVAVGSYGCGWSPECQEANRLMASGVVVCAAASNDGHKVLATVSGGKLELFPTYLDIGISDPGNAEEIITVGSTHKENPHAYGPSFFSSKGPTGDGRAKPDCVAPGEKIVSAKAGTKDGTVEMSGTSMATPHVCGAIALFLSAKPEFMGRAREVKQILLRSCTDLNRDRYFQGAGLVDVLRMIQSV